MMRLVGTAETGTEIPANDRRQGEEDRRQQKEGEDRDEVTIGSLTAMFEEAYFLALKIGKVSAAISAVTAIGQLHGLIEVNGKSK